MFHFYYYNVFILQFTVHINTDKQHFLNELISIFFFFFTHWKLVSCLFENFTLQDFLEHTFS